MKRKLRAAIAVLCALPLFRCSSPQVEQLMAPPIFVSRSPNQANAGSYPASFTISTPAEAGEHDYVVLSGLSVKCTNVERFNSRQVPTHLNRGRQARLGDLVLDGIQDGTGVGVRVMYGLNTQNIVIYFAKGGLCDVETQTTRVDLYLPDVDLPAGMLYSILIYPVHWQVPTIVPGAANPARVSQNSL